MRASLLLKAAVLLPLLVSIGYFTFRLVKQHGSIHSGNSCGMTFMWRRIFLIPIPVPAYKENRYSLLNYNEGFAFPEDFVGGKNDIPILFVPGSGGSGAQVRSLASVMQNKTDTRKSPFRMHFYALDFKEEMSFISGQTLVRQRDFLMEAIKIIRGKFPLTSDKLILFGHSFGGVVIRSLPLHPDFQPNFMNLVITKASPLLHSHLAMANFYNEVEDLWDNTDKLRHVKFISISGGEKDFQVPDRLVTVENTIHLPSWSLPGVQTPADHLCILWCNQLVRYVTRVLFKYGEKSINMENPNLTHEVIAEFEKTQTDRLSKYREIIALSKPASISEAGIFGSDSNPRKLAYRLDLPNSHASEIHVQCTDSRGFICSEKLKTTIRHPNGWLAFGENSKLHGIRVKSLLLRPDIGRPAYLILESPEDNVDYVITVSTDFFRTWYMIATTYAFNIISNVFVMLILAIPIEAVMFKPTNIGSLLLSCGFFGVAFLIYSPLIIAFGLTGILLIIADLIPIRRFIVTKLYNQYFCIAMALLHPDLTPISTLLYSKKTQSSVVYQLLLLMSIATIVPTLFEGGRPHGELPRILYFVTKDIIVLNPTWLFLISTLAEDNKFIQTKGIISKILVFCAGANGLAFLLSSSLFEQMPLILFPMIISHFLLMSRFNPSVSVWSSRKTIRK